MDFNIPNDSPRNPKKKVAKKKKEKPSAWSYTQISTFLTCRHQYYLKYVVGVPSAPTKFMTWGNEVHAAIEGEPIEAPYVVPYVNAVKKFYAETEDEPEHRELDVTFEFAGHNVRCKIDALTKNGFIDDYKVTSAPSRLKRLLPYQLGLYRLAAQQLGMGDYQPRYIFLKRDKCGEFVELGEFCPEFTPKREFLLVTYLKQIMDEMEECWTDGKWYFNPNADCFHCAAKDVCPFYLQGRKDYE